MRANSPGRRTAVLVRHHGAQLHRAAIDVDLGVEGGDRADEATARQSVDGDGDRLARYQLGQPALGEPEIEVERVDALERHELVARLDIPPDAELLQPDHAVERRHDVGVVQALPGHRRLGLRRAQRRPRLVQRLRRGGATLRQRLGAAEVLLRQRQRRLGLGQLRLKASAGRA